METTRQQKISRLLQKELGDIFLQIAKQINGVIISVSEVRISTDLSISHVHLSIFPTDKTNTVIELVKKENRTIRYELGKRVRHQLRLIPELIFHNDESIDYLENIDKLLNQDKKKNEE